MEPHNKKVLLVTGSTHGIGKATVLELANLDYSVVINGAATKSLPKEYISELKNIYNEEINNRTLYVQADISKKEDRDLLLQKIKEKFKRIDVLVNNAGTGVQFIDLIDTGQEYWDRVQGTNLRAVALLSKALLK